MIKAVIFDIGNVLLPFDFTIAVKKLEASCTAFSPSIFAAVEPLKIAYESGQIDRADFLTRIRPILRYTGSDADFVGAWEDIFSENAAMSDLVRALHARYPLFLLSNTGDIHVDFIFRMYPVFELFQDAVYSYRVKCLKPDRAIYEI